MAVNNIPKLPEFDDFTGFRFIARAALVGCYPDIWLALEFARPPATDLFLGIVTPDLFDIGQAIFEPNKGRRTKPNRHGRKGRGGVGIPDTSDIIGKIIRSKIDPADVLSLTPTKFLFRFLNIYEGINFAIFLVDGVQKTTFAAFYGPLMFRPLDCPSFGRFQRSNIEGGLAGEANQPGGIMNMLNLDSEQGIVTTQYSVSADDADVSVAWRASFRSQSWQGSGEATLYWRDSMGNVLGASPPVNVSPDGWTDRTVSCTIPKGATGSPWLVSTIGPIQFKDAYFIGWEQDAVPWWPFD